MLNELKFVMGAVSSKDFIPALTHFKIENSTVRSFNGTLALCSPIELDINCAPQAVPLVKAIQNCKEAVNLTLTASGKLSVKSGPFKALVNCVDFETPHALPEGDFFEIDGASLLEGFKTLYPFIGDDASRPWSNGVLLSGSCAFATNNVIAVQYWAASSFPLMCNLPRQAVKEIIRIGEPPIKAQANENNITFHYSENRWLRSQLLETKWPDIDKMLNIENNPVKIDPYIFEALLNLKPFMDDFGRAFFKGGMISTHADLSEGASFEVPSVTFEAIFNLEMFLKLASIAEAIDLTTYPGPAIFTGKKLRGAIMGMRPL